MPAVAVRSGILVAPATALKQAAGGNQRLRQPDRASKSCRCGLRALRPRRKKRFQNQVHTNRLTGQRGVGVESDRLFFDFDHREQDEVSRVGLSLELVPHGDVARKLVLVDPDDSVRIAHPETLLRGEADRALLPHRHRP
jgi:hypothetical protein